MGRKVFTLNGVVQNPKTAFKESAIASSLGHAQHIIEARLVKRLKEKDSKIGKIFISWGMYTITDTPPRSLIRKKSQINNRVAY